MTKVWRPCWMKQTKQPNKSCHPTWRLDSIDNIQSNSLFNITIREEKNLEKHFNTHKKNKTTSEKRFAVVVTAFSSSYVCDEVIIKIIVDQCGKTYDGVFVNVIVGIKKWKRIVPRETFCTYRVRLSVQTRFKFSNNTTRTMSINNSLILNRT